MYSTNTIKNTHVKYLVYCLKNILKTCTKLQLPFLPGNKKKMSKVMEVLHVQASSLDKPQLK